MRRRFLFGWFSSPWVICGGSLAVVGLLALLLAWNPSRTTGGAFRGELTVYCAAGLLTPVEAICAKYERENPGIRVRVQPGNSESLLANIELADRGDLFLPADRSYIEKARSRKKKLVDESLPVATMHPILAVHKDNPRKVQGLADLRRKEVVIGLADPDRAAVGELCRAALQKTNQWAEIAKRAKVTKPTVTDIANDIKLGTIHAGFIWDAMLTQYPDLQAVEAPELKGATAEVEVAVLHGTENPTAALRLARYLAASDRGLLAFAQFGYQPVEGDAWADPPEVLLFSGAMLREAIEKTVTEFERREGIKINYKYDGCGALVGQMKTGTRPDAYFACNQPFMRKKAARDLFPDSVVVSENEVVILTAKGNPLGIQGLRDLVKPKLRIGVTHPEKSALGALTRDLFEDEGLYEEFLAQDNARVNAATGDALVSGIRLNPNSLDAVIVFKSNAAYVKDDLEVIPLASPRAVSPYQLVALVPKGNPKGVQAARDLAVPGLKVGIADPQTPLGVRTQRLLDDEGVLDEFLAAGNAAVNAESGDELVTALMEKAETLNAVVVLRVQAARLKDQVEIVPLGRPVPKAIQPFAISQHSKHKHLLRRLRQALLAPESRQHFEELGFRWQVKE